MWKKQALLKNSKTMQKQEAINEIAAILKFKMAIIGHLSTDLDDI